MLRYSSKLHWKLQLLPRGEFLIVTQRKLQLGHRAFNCLFPQADPGGLEYEREVVHCQFTGPSGTALITDPCCVVCVDFS